MPPINRDRCRTSVGTEVTINGLDVTHQPSPECPRSPEVARRGGTRTHNLRINSPLSRRFSELDKRPETYAAPESPVPAVPAISRPV